MKKVLKTKLAKGNSNQLRAHVFGNIADYISRDEVQEATENVVHEMCEVTDGKKVAFGWSAGKDSIVIADLCKLAGINNSIMALSRLEFPEFERWAKANRPGNCQIIYTKHDIRWLSEHQDRLFPESSKGDNIWFQEIQRDSIKRYYRENSLDMMVLGRRTADGNSIPQKIQKKKDGQVTYCPIRDWPHELLLGYIVYNELPSPPLYDWEDGWVYGTHPWPLRKQRPPSVMGSWKSVYDIDHTVVERASEYIESARIFLDSINK